MRLHGSTSLVSETGTTLTVDGVPMEFQMVSGSEAPAEFTFYLPEHKAFCGAELVSRNMHNLYTLRGAKVRDARIWSGFIDEAKNRFAEEAAGEQMAIKIHFTDLDQAYLLRLQNSVFGMLDKPNGRFNVVVP